MARKMLAVSPLVRRMIALLLLWRTLMRTMLVGAVMLLACLSGAARADEASAVKAVENLGGKVTRDDKLPGKPVIGVNLPATKVTDAGLKELKDLKHLTSLNLNDTKVTDEVRKAWWKEMKHLKLLNSVNNNNNDKMREDQKTERKERRHNSAISQPKRATM